jgi:hypothetical protein
MRKLIKQADLDAKPYDISPGGRARHNARRERASQATASR